MKLFFETFVLIRKENMFGNDGDAKPVLLGIFKLLLRPWDLSHCVERQKLMVISHEEMSVRVRKGGFVADLLLLSIFGPNVLFETW